MEGKGSPCQDMVQEGSMVLLYLENNRKGKISDKTEQIREGSPDLLEYSEVCTGHGHDLA